MVSFEKKEKNFVVIICNYSVCKVKGNESEMVHCLLCGMGYFNFETGKIICGCPEGIDVGASIY